MCKFINCTFLTLSYHIFYQIKQKITNKYKHTLILLTLFVAQFFMEIKITRLSQVSNAIFFISATYFLNFLWLEYHFHSINKALVLSIPLTISIALIAYFIKKKLKSKSNSKEAIQREKDHLKTQLMWGNEDVIYKYLIDLFGLGDLKKITNCHYILSQTRDVFFSFEEENLNTKNFAQIIRQSSKKFVTIFCICEPPQYRILNTDITFITLNDIYNKRKNSSSPLPTNIKIENKPKYSLKSILCIVLNRNRSKKYFWSSILLIFMSLFTPYNIYYLIISTILLLLSLYSRFNTKFNN